MIRSNLFLRIICPVFILCIFISRIAFAGTTHIRPSPTQKTSTKENAAAEEPEAHDQEGEKQLEFKDFLMEVAYASPTFQIERVQQKVHLNFRLPVIHLPIPIQPPR